MNVVLVHNADAGDQEYTTRELLRLLRRHGYKPTVRTLAGLRHVSATGPDGFVIAAGGDGCVKRVARVLAGTGRPLAILPLGTANNIAHSLGLAGEPEKIIAGWAAGSREAIDLGIAHGPWGRRYFIESMGIGLIGRAIAIMKDIARVSSRELASREDRLFRDLCVLLALTREFQPVTMRLAEDGKRSKVGRFLLCELLNIRRSGPGVELSRSADPADGFLDLVSVEAGERHKLQTLLERFLAGKLAAPLLHTRRVQDARLTLGPHEVRIDDEIVWPLPRQPTGSQRISVTVEVAPRALEYVRPRGFPPPEKRSST